MRRIALALGAIALVAACSSDDDDGAQPAATNEVEVLGTDGLAFDPEAITVPAGEEVSVTLTSEAAVEHDLVIEDVDGEDLVVVEAAAGETATGTFALDEPGEYLAYCSIPGHREAGMEATVTVTGDAAADDAPEADATSEARQPELVVPYAITPDGAARFEGAPRLVDAVDAKHATYAAGVLHNDAEMGHPAYDPALAEEPMEQLGHRWLLLLESLRDGFEVEPGVLAPTMTEVADGWEPDGDPDLADYSNAVYAYHMHHRADRWEGFDGLFDAITFAPGLYQAALVEHVVGQHEGGLAEGDPNDPTAAVTHGLGALHAGIYAWVRQTSPDGEPDMGQLDDERMEAAFGHDLDELVELMRAIAVELDERWDAEAGAFVFGEDATYELEQLGALLQGLKGLYEGLAQFGDDEDAAQAAALAENTATMLEALLDVDGDHVEPWGIASEVTFTAEGVVAASDTVDVAAQWQLINRMTGGFSVDREREGENSPGFLGELAPELDTWIGEMGDLLLLGSLEHHGAADGLVVAEVSHADGEVSDDTHTVRAVGSLLTGLSNAYTSGDAFVAADGWEEADDDVVERSQHLYEVVLTHSEALHAAIDDASG